MRTIIILACTVAFAAVAIAECDFPYYPEYADRISQYEIVTPLLAKKFALEHPHPDAGAGSLLCEPLLVRDILGAPFFYSVTFYNGGDDNVVKKWNEVVTILQSTTKTSAADLAEKVSYFEAADIRSKFRSITVSAYTFGTGPYSKYAGIPQPVRGYETAYEKAQQEFGAAEVYFSRLIGASYVENQIFEFENDLGEKIAVHVTVTGRYRYEADIADLEGNSTQAKGVAKGWHDFLVSDPESANRRRVKWEEIDRKIPDETVKRGIPTSDDAINMLLDYTDTLYAFCVAEVPDPVQGASLCWSTACAAIWTFHAQHGGPRFTNAPDPGYFGESGYNGMLTDNYCSWVDGHFFEFAIGLNAGNAAEVCCKAYAFSESNTLNGDKNPWKYEVYTDKQYDPIPPCVTHHHRRFKYIDAKGIHEDLHPVVVGLVDTGYAHMCPGIGYGHENNPPGPDDPRYIVVWDMKGERYEPEEIQDWEQTTENPFDSWHAIRMHIPGPAVIEDTWVKSLAVERGPREHILTWEVGSSEDVKGFNIYNGTYENPGNPLNEKLIAPDGFKQREFSYTVETPSENAHYVIELVRITEDEYRFLFPEEIY